MTLSTKVIVGQESCKDAVLLGDWAMVNNFNFHRTLNLDSLVQIIDNSTKTLSVWTFRDNGTYDLKSDERKENGHYNFLSDSCKITLGQKKMTLEGLIFHILLIDEKHLIMKCTKPKGDFIYLHRRA